AGRNHDTAYPPRSHRRSRGCARRHRLSLLREGQLHHRSCAFCRRGQFDRHVRSRRTLCRHRDRRAMTMSNAPPLRVENLTIAIDGASVVDGVSFSVAAGEVVALVGESGCGKSLTALALLGLLPDAAQIVRGRIMLNDVDLVSLPEREMRRMRGSRLSIIFQEATASLDP